MSELDGLEQFDVLANRFAIADFSKDEDELIRGVDPCAAPIAISNFNWVAAYLVEELGLNEIEVAIWFRSEARSLDGRSPIQIWNNPDGFNDVFEYAQTYRDMVDETFEDEQVADESPLERSQTVARSALAVILKSFEIAGVDVAPNPKFLPDTTSLSLWNPDKPSAPHVRWKGNDSLEDYRITLQDGGNSTTYYICRRIPKEGRPFIMQSGIAEIQGKKTMLTDTDSDIDGRPPTVGQVAHFVVAVANESRNNSLILNTAAA